MEKVHSYTCFEGMRRLATGPLSEIALVVKRALAVGAQGSVLVFDDFSGRSLDLNTQGSEAEVLARHAPVPVPEPEAEADEVRGRGRPKLGVVAREVTLLPRHWDWLATQPGGASVALRKLVENARRDNQELDRARQATERSYTFLSALAGDLPGFEEASRALFAGDQVKLTELMAAWPLDVREHALHLLVG